MDERSHVSSAIAAPAARNGASGSATPSAARPRRSVITTPTAAASISPNSNAGAASAAERERDQQRLLDVAHPERGRLHEREDEQPAHECERGHALAQRGWSGEQRADRGRRQHDPVRDAVLAQVDERQRADRGTEHRQTHKRESG